MDAIGENAVATRGHTGQVRDSQSSPLYTHGTHLESLGDVALRSGAWLAAAGCRWCSGRSAQAADAARSARWRASELLVADAAGTPRGDLVSTRSARWRALGTAWLLRCWLLVSPPTAWRARGRPDGGPSALLGESDVGRTSVLGRRGGHEVGQMAGPRCR